MIETQNRNMLLNNAIKYTKSMLNMLIESLASKLLLQVACVSPFLVRGLGLEPLMNPN
jgi:hypothetical protein